MNCMVAEYNPVIHIVESHLYELAWSLIAALFAHTRSLPAPYPADTGGNLVGRGQNWKRGQYHFYLFGFVGRSETLRTRHSRLDFRGLAYSTPHCWVSPRNHHHCTGEQVEWGIRDL